jgi:glucose uptake protein GlcU
MKDYISLVVITLFILFIGVFCNYYVTDQKEKAIEKSIEEKKYEIVLIDSCEYLEYSVMMKYGNAYTTSSYITKMITHKGNCKFCLKRNKK